MAGGGKMKEDRGRTSWGKGRHAKRAHACGRVLFVVGDGRHGAMRDWRIRFSELQGIGRCGGFGGGATRG